MGASSYHAIQLELERVKKIAKQESAQQNKNTKKYEYLKFIIYAILISIAITSSGFFIDHQNNEDLNRRVEKLENANRVRLLNSANFQNKKIDLYDRMPSLTLPKTGVKLNWHEVNSMKNI